MICTVTDWYASDKNRSANSASLKARTYAAADIGFKEEEA